MTDGERSLLMRTRRHAVADNRRALLQLLVTLPALALLLAITRGEHGSALRFLSILPLALLLVRLFVFQHDCGHRSFLRGARANDLLGTGLSFITGIPFEPWRTEHNWHHRFQGRLSCRGIDGMNSPMTLSEARQAPAKAAVRVRKINSPNVFLLGAFSLLVQRKWNTGFFQFRPGFRWSFPNKEQVIRGLWATLAGHAAWHAALIALLGLTTWATVMLPSCIVAAGFGSWLFWVQHNFERTFHADDDRWSFVEVAVKGSSYLKLPWPLRWFTADIGLHHVHHLNPRIPNYALERARLEIEPLAKVPALNLADLRRCFSHVFWDARTERMVSPAELSSGAATLMG